MRFKQKLPLQLIDTSLKALCIWSSCLSFSPLAIYLLRKKKHLSGKVFPHSRFYWLHCHDGFVFLFFNVFVSPVFPENWKFCQWLDHNQFWLFFVSFSTDFCRRYCVFFVGGIVSESIQCLMFFVILILNSGLSVTSLV